MGDFNFGGTDEESAEIKKLNTDVVSHLHLFRLYRKAAANCAD
jgi:hypothetical protein